MTRKKVSKRNAPYVAAKAISAFFERIRYVSTPDKVDVGLLLDYGISKGNVFALISAIKFLGLVDDEGVPTSAFTSLQVTGEDFTIALENIIRNAYEDLFSKLDASRDSREHIRNYFARNYSAAKASDSTNLFLALCRQAQIPLSEELQSSRGGVLLKAKPKSVSRKISSDVSREAMPQVQSQVIVSEDELRKMYLKQLIDHIVPPDTAGKDAEAIKAEAELRKVELDRIERLLKIIKTDDKNEESA